MGKSNFVIFVYWFNDTSCSSHSRLSSSSNNPSPANHTQNMSVAAVHHDPDVIPVSLCERVNLKPEWESLAVAYTDCLPPEDCAVVVEPRIATEKDSSDDATFEPFTNIFVARTLATWSAFDGSVAVQICNPSGDGAAFYQACILAICTRHLLSPLTI